jgi:bifunctional oligoribonuclease and PAP phosphatase NrnA
VSPPPAQENSPLVPTFDSAARGAELCELLRTARSVTAVCHENPDADTIGGAIAMALIADRMGKPSEIVSVDAPGPAYGFLPRIEDVRGSPELPPDVAIVCDAATLERVGRVLDESAEWFSQARIVNIDHHVTNSAFGSVNVVDPTAAATCQVIAEILPVLEVNLDAEIATALLTGVVRDSHGFSDQGTSPRTLRVAAELVEAGADLSFIHRRILAELPYRTMALWGKMLHRIGQRLDGRIVYSVLTLDMLAETGTEQHDGDGLAEFMANAKGADITILLRELGPTDTRVSLRVSPSVDATRIARAFGGGGHARRAGCTVPAPIEDAVAQVLAVSEQVLLDRSEAAPD